MIDRSTNIRHALRQRQRGFIINPFRFGGGGGGSGHRYWRAYITAGNGATATSAAEFGLRDTVGGSSIATGGTPSASTEFNSSFDAAKAFDGNPSTLWSAASNSGFPAWLAYDFGTAVDIVEVSYTCRNDAVANQAWRNFSIQYSDDNSTWTTSWSVTNQTGWSLGETRVFTKP